MAGKLECLEGVEVECLEGVEVWEVGVLGKLEGWVVGKVEWLVGCRRGVTYHQYSYDHTLALMGCPHLW